MLLSTSAPRRRQFVIGLFILLLLAPVCFVFIRTAEARRNVAYWDELDTALAMVLRLKDRPTLPQLTHELFAINNEHRMVTSRLLYAANFAVTGSVNFVFINVVGNGTIVALCLLLVASAGSTERRLCMAALLSALMFQLEHYESFMWSGASIDHFSVVLFAAVTMVAVARNTRAGLIVGALSATLATFTLAHGILTWPIGAAMLWRAENRRGAALWSALAVLAVGGFLAGFRFNHAQQFAGFSADGVLTVARYWLTILGALPAMGGNTLALMLGVVLLILGVGLTLNGAPRREPIAFSLLVFAIAALGLIAVGRAEHSGGVVYSRYYVLSGTAWAMVIFMLLVRYSHPSRPWLLLAGSVPALAVFNITSDRAFTAPADSWLECRDRAVVSYVRYGVDGKGPLTLHPLPAHATELLQAAERRGVFRMAPVCVERPFPKTAKVSTRIPYFVDDITVDGHSAYMGGWAAVKGETSRRGHLFIVLRSERETRLYSAVTETRPDVAKATQEPGWELSGFRFARRRDELPTGDFQLGFLLLTNQGIEYTLTAHRMNLTGAGSAVLATGE